jgi:hypothetical protein
MNLSAYIFALLDISFNDTSPKGTLHFPSLFPLPSLETLKGQEKMHDNPQSQHVQNDFDPPSQPWMT